MLTAEQMRVLVIHLVRDPATIRAAAGKLEDYLFDATNETLPLVFWRVSRTLFAKHSQIVPVEVFGAEVGKIINEEFPQSGVTVEVLATALATIYSYPKESIGYNFVADWLREFLIERQLTPKLNSVAFSGGNYTQLLDDISKVAKRTIVSSVMVEDLSSLGLDLFAERARTMTGNRPVDKLMGGIRFKESICLLGPMKGGKTSLAHSIITDFIKMSPENRATFVSYEEPAAQQIPKMYVSFMNKYKLDDLNGKKFSDMPAVIQKDLQVAATYVNQRINFVDMSGTRGQGHGGPAELQQCLMSLHEAGRLGKLVIVDHLYPMVTSHMAAQGADKTQMRHFILDASKSFVETIAACDVAGIMAHQMDAKGNKDPLRQPTHMDAAECKLLPQYFHDVTALGVRNAEDNIAWLNLSCSRTTQPRAIHVHVAGWKCRVDVAEGFTENETTGAFMRQEDNDYGRSARDGAIGPVVE